MSNLMLSIGITTYNHEKYIAQAIESILSQKTEYNFEILINENSSTDSTKKIINQYHKKYPNIIRPFYFRQNYGATKSGYCVLKHMKGKYIAFCDGDDYWCDDYRIQRDIDFLESHKQYSAVSNRCIVVDEDGSEIPSRRIDKRSAFWEFNKKEFTFNDFEEWKLPGHISGLTMKNIFLTEDNDLSIYYKASKNVGDRSLVLFSTLYGPICCLPYKTSCYRFRVSETQANFMSDYKKKNLKDEDFLMIRKLEYWALNKKGIILNLDNVKKDRLVGSTVIFLRTPTIYNFKVMSRIIRYSGEPLKYIYYISKIFSIKMYYWHIKKTDKMICL